jgi:hydroxyacylglutathione hydrolase
MPEVISIPVGPLEANCFVVYSEKSREAIIVDPGDDARKIIDIIQSNNLQPVLIVNTHGHMDHIGANATIKDTFSVPIAIHEDDSTMLTNPSENLSSVIGTNTVSPAADQLLHEGDTVDLDGTEIKIIHTPGHSPGGICLYFDSTLIAGDTLFKGSIGRTDLPNGDFPTLISSIQQKLEVLGDEVVVYPGHGPKTTIGDEKRSNPFLLKPPVD